MHFLSLNPNVLSSGLNNQKLAFLGLLLFAKEQGAKIVMPEGVIDNKKRKFIALSEVCQPQILVDFLGDWGLLSKEDALPENFIDCAPCFNKGVNYIRDNKKKLKDDLFLTDFFSAIITASEIKEMAEKCLETIGDDLPALQLRVEKDWFFHVEKKIKLRKPGFRHYTIEDIFNKIKSSMFFRDNDTYLICCDELMLTTPPVEIKLIAKKKFGLNLIFRKHDLGLYFDGSGVKNAVLDFEICFNLKKYIGLSQSTFSNVLCITQAIAKNSSNCFESYIYNVDECFLQPYDVNDLQFS